tara:strand:+ start:1161 stop:1346 length:186 start_codon:yes stop_codon:yes gene_type:complete
MQQQSGVLRLLDDSWGMNSILFFLFIISGTYHWDFYCHEWNRKYPKMMTALLFPAGHRDCT